MKITSQIRRRRFSGIAPIVGALFGAPKSNRQRVTLIAQTIGVTFIVTRCCNNNDDRQ